MIALRWCARGVSHVVLAALVAGLSACVVKEAAPQAVVQPEGGTPAAGGSAEAPARPNPDPAADGPVQACAAFQVAEDATVSHFVSTRYHTWEPGTKLKVAFLDGKPEYKTAVARLASQWKKYANIDFEFDAPAAESHIRVTFQLDGYWSAIGNQAMWRSKARPTMNFNWRLFGTSERNQNRVVLHEFGHSLGLWHEQQNPNLKVTWNKPYIYAHYKRTNGWDKKMVDDNVLSKLDPDSVDATEFDSKSIMLYSFPKEFTVEQIVIGHNYELSAMDKVHIAKLYPGSAQPPPPDPGPDPDPDPVAPPKPDPSIADGWARQVGFDYMFKPEETGNYKRYVVFVRAPQGVMEKIDHVLYQRQHGSFPEFVNGTGYRSAGIKYRFGFEWRGWGWVHVKARIVFKNGEVRERFASGPPKQLRQGPNWQQVKASVKFHAARKSLGGNWNIYGIELATASAAEHIDWIEYQRQHKSFSEYAQGRFLRMTGRDKNFALVWKGWGWVPIVINVHFKDGSTMRYQYSDKPVLIH